MSLLHIGDIISLYSEGFLSTLGLVDDRCVLQPTTSRENEEEFNIISSSSSTSSSRDPPKKFRDCLFKVCIQHKYDVQGELWRSEHISDADSELYKKLEAAAKSEQLTNREKNQSKRGTVVKYEDTIQLLHIKSNKFITVNSKVSAPVEEEARRVYLDSNGNEGSWFKVKSPYKYRSNGEDVVCESIALVSDHGGAVGVGLGGVLTSAQQEDMLYLHASEWSLRDTPDCLEINASRQSTSWDVKPFLDFTEDLDEFLKGGDVVRLFHTDQEKFLTMDTYQSEETQHVFLRSTDRAKATSATSSKALWEVEVVHADPCRASLAQWNSLIRLKHLATERFLAADQDDDQTHDPMREKLRQKGAPVYKLISIEFSYDYSTLFEFDSTQMNVNGDDYIPIHSNITLKHHPTGSYVHSTSIYIDKDNKKSCMSKVGCAQHKGLDEVFAVIPVSATEIRDLDFVSDTCLLLNEAHELIRNEGPEGREEAHRKLDELLPEVLHFIANKESEPRKADKAMSMLAEDPNRERQKLLREQNVLKLLFDILELEDSLEESNKNICRLCYRVLRLSFQDYRKNQEYFVKWDKAMQRQFGKDIFAEFTYAELFHSNKNLLEKYVKSTDIAIFVQLIRQKRQSNFLDCLSDLCTTSNGLVSRQTQAIVCESILNESSRDILIETSVISGNTNTTNQPANGSGNDQQQHTSQLISLSTQHWSSFELPGSSSPVGAGDCVSSQNYLIEEICQTRKSLAEIVMAARNKYEVDIFILDYYRHQLDLFSAMCMARQMKAIQILSDKLSLQLIQSCISSSELPCELRASFCRLLLHLHLNRDPQKLKSPVHLKQNWLDLPNKISVESYDHRFANQDNSNLGKFHSTMEFLEFYLTDLTSSKFSSNCFSMIFENSEKNKLTFEVVNLNRELTYFGFYKLSVFLRLSELMLTMLADDKNQQQLVMKTKTKIIEILQYISEVRLDYMLTTLLIIFKSSSTAIDSSSQLVTKTNQALDEHLNEINLDSSHGKKFVNVLLHLVKHNCPDLVSASLKLLLNYRSQRHRILETYRQIDLVDAPTNTQENFRKLHPLIERSDRYINKGRDENHVLVNEVLLSDSKLVSYIVQHIQYLIRSKDEESLTMDLLRLLRDLIPPLDFINISTTTTTTTQHHNHYQTTSSSSGGSASTILNNSQSTHNNHLSTPSSSRKSSSRTVPNLINGVRNNHHSNNSNNNNKNKQPPPPMPTLSEIQNKLDSHGTSSLIVELIAMGSSLCEEKVRERSALVFKDTLSLAIALLDGGNQDIQSSFYDKLNRKSEQDKSERFFEVISNRMNLAQQALSPNTDLHQSKSLPVNGLGGAASGGGSTASGQPSLKLLHQRKQDSDQHSSPNLKGLLRQLSSNSTTQERLCLTDSLREDMESTIETTEKVLDITKSSSSTTTSTLSYAANKYNRSTNKLPEVVRVMKPILRFLQLLCEDHNLTMQNFIREQQQNRTSYNLVSKTLVFLNCVCGSKEGSLGHKLGEFIKENNVDLINQTLRTLTEYCQGPCIENQRCILMHESNGIDMIRSLVLDKIEPLDSLRMDLVLELKDNASKLLLALMESCSDPEHAGRILREASLTNKLIEVAINYYHEQEDCDHSFAELNSAEEEDWLNGGSGAAGGGGGTGGGWYSMSDGMVRPRDVGHKVFILCHQLVQQYNNLLIGAGSGAVGGNGSGGGGGTGGAGFAGGGGGANHSSSHGHHHHHHHHHHHQVTLAKIPTSGEAMALANKCESEQQQSSSITGGGQASEEKAKYLREAQALRYYESHTAQIEIVRSNGRGQAMMERVVFPVPQICEYLTHETKLSIYLNTEQDERGSKIPSFFQSIDELFDEMKWQRELQTKPILHSIARYMSLWSSLEFKLSCLVTVLVLFCVSKVPTSSHTATGGGGACDAAALMAAAATAGESSHLSATSSCFLNNQTTSCHDGDDEILNAREIVRDDDHIPVVDCSSSSSSSNNMKHEGEGDAHYVMMMMMLNSFIPSLLTTFLALACSTFFLFKPRIPHSWTLGLICTTIYLAQVLGKCASLKILGLFLESVTIMHLFSVLINKGIINKPLQHILLESADFMYHGGYLLVCTLGFLVNPLFYPFLITPSVIRREETLRNVIKSVTKNAYAIYMTGFLGLIIILLYTIINYLFFAEDFVIDLDDDGSQYKPCLGTLWECYVAHVNYGLRSGGGIGDRMRDIELDLSRPKHLLYFFVILTFFLFVVLMILQLVYCIIVDTFATLRSEKTDKEEVLRNTCFVCGLDRSSFENHQVTFEEHIANEHNLWHYLYFIVLIKTKSRTELSGPESFVHDMIKNKDHSWFPRMRAMSLALNRSD